MEFQSFPKIARLSRECIVTEKIDGTNGCIFIGEGGDDVRVEFLVGSRTRWITPVEDNHGFARWAYEHMEELLKLGPGRHFGEWWGNGIQRGYGLVNGDKRFSLFNTARWSDPEVRPACCGVVPVLYEGLFDTHIINQTLMLLGVAGSYAAPGFMRPEGIIVFHTARGYLFKKTIEKDSVPKGLQK